jgi:hypothetical protein
MIDKDNLTSVVWHCVHLLQSAGYLRRAKTDKLHDIFNKVRNCNFIHWAVAHGKDHGEWMYNLSCPIKMRKRVGVCLMNCWESNINPQIKMAINPHIQNHQIQKRLKLAFCELPLCDGGTTVKCGSPCACKSGRKIVSIIGLMECFHSCRSTYSH